MIPFYVKAQIDTKFMTLLLKPVNIIRFSNQFKFKILDQIKKTNTYFYKKSNIRIHISFNFIFVIYTNVLDYNTVKFSLRNNRKYTTQTKNLNGKSYITSPRDELSNAQTFPGKFRDFPKKRRI